MTTEVSAGIVSKGKSVLMRFDDKTETWDLPTARSERGELSADTAERAIKELGGECESIRYRNKLKDNFELDGEDFTVQTFAIELLEEPEEAEWIHVDELEEKKLAPATKTIKEALIEKIS